MQFSIKSFLTIAVGMATLASAAAVDATAVGSSAVDAALAGGDPNDQGIYTCCAYGDCTVCADYGHINDCSPCGGVSPTPNKVLAEIISL